MLEKGMVEQQQQQQQQRLRKPVWKRLKLAVPLVILFVVIIVLVVDLALKPEPAVIEHNWVLLEEIFLTNSSSIISSNGTISSNSSPLFDMRFRVVILMSNPNLAGRFRYYNAGVYMFFKGKLVGQSSITAGSIQTQSSLNLSTVVHAVFPEKISDDVTLSAQTNMTGFVSKSKIFKHHFVLDSTCDVKLFNKTVISSSCDQ